MVKLWIVAVVATILAISTTARIHSIIDFYGDVTCHFPAYKYKLDVWEADNIKDDHLASFEAKISFRPHKVNFTVHDYGDGNNFYEFYFIIIHNCTDTGEVHKAEWPLPDVPVVDGRYSNYTQIYMTNMGEPTNEEL